MSFGKKHQIQISATAYMNRACECCSFSVYQEKEMAVTHEMAVSHEKRGATFPKVGAVEI